MRASASSCTVGEHWSTVFPTLRQYLTVISSANALRPVLHRLLHHLASPAFTSTRPTASWNTAAVYPSSGKKMSAVSSRPAEANGHTPRRTQWPGHNTCSSLTPSVHPRPSGPPKPKTLPKHLTFAESRIGTRCVWCRLYRRHYRQTQPGNH